MKTLTLEIEEDRLESLTHTLGVALSEALLLAGQDGMESYLDDLKYLLNQLDAMQQDLSEDNDLKRTYKKMRDLNNCWTCKYGREDPCPLESGPEPMASSVYSWVEENGYDDYERDGIPMPPPESDGCPGYHKE